MSRDHDVIASRSMEPPDEGWTCAACEEHQTGDPENYRCDLCDDFICSECANGHDCTEDEDDDE